MMNRRYFLMGSAAAGHAAFAQSPDERVPTAIIGTGNRGTSLLRGVLQQANGRCSRGHTTPKKMRCVDFTPGIERFCSTPADYTGREQLKQMASFFGIKGKELERVLAMSETRTTPD